MRAMILAAGRGERMRPLSDTTPKPMLHVKGKPLIAWQIERLRTQGFKDIVINIAYLGEQIMHYCGSGAQWGVQIAYSDERESGALESAGGIKKALPLLGDGTFLVLNADVWSDYAFDANVTLQDDQAHLILVPNPPQHPKGDFCLQGCRVRNEGSQRYTFSGIGYYNADFFKALPEGKLALGALLREAAQSNAIGGSLFGGEWRDIGTPQRLEQLKRSMDV